MIVSIGFIIACVFSTKSPNQTDGNSTQPPPPPTDDPNGLQLFVNTKADVIGDLPVTMVQLHIKGCFSFKRHIYKPLFVITMTDVTDSLGDKGFPLLSFVDNFQNKNNTEFRYTQGFDRSLKPGTGPSDWVQFAAVPKEVLVFPMRGNRRVKVLLRVRDRANGQILTSARAFWSTEVNETGYLEIEEVESEAQGASLQLGMCIAAADGSIDDNEVAVIKTWGERTVNALPDEHQSKRQSALNEALKTATREIRRGESSQLEADALNVLKGKEELRFQYDAYELCLNVLKADGEAHPEEMAQMTRIAKALDLDETKVRVLTDRHLANVDFAAGGDANAEDQILGITEDMTGEEIRKHLNKLYKKHQGRTQHDKPDVRKKAKEWLDRIAEARVRHLG